VSSSSSQYWMRSFPDTSALLPTLTKLESPRPRSRAYSRMASPSAPLCEDMATRPWGGKTGEKLAFIRTSGAVLIRPRQLGPTMRIP